MARKSTSIATRNRYRSIKKVSSEEKYVKWWDEISPSIMPYVLAEDVNITKGF